MKKKLAIFLAVFFSIFFALPVLAFDVFRQDNSVFIWNGTPNEYPSYAYQLFDLTTGGFPVFTLEQYQLLDEPVEITDFLIKNHQFGIVQGDNAGCYTYTFEECIYNWIYNMGGLRGSTTFNFPLGVIINLPLSGLEDLFATAGTLFTDLWIVIAIAIGVPLAFYIINQTIATVRKH